MTQIRDIMKECIVAVRPETTLAEAVRILGRHHVDTAPVVTDDQIVVGMISERELMDVLFDRGVRSDPISAYMARELVLLSPDDPLSRAAQLFVLHGFRRLPVVERGVLVGIVTRKELLSHTLDNDELLTEPLIELLPELAPMS
jgi:CBS domain-containing protein